MFAAYFLFIDLCRNLGWRRGVLLAIAWLARREFLVLVRKLDRVGTLPSPDASIRWVHLKDEHAGLLPRLNPALKAGEISRRRLEGQVCDLAFVGESLAHYRWTATSPVYLPYLGKSCVVEPGDLLVTELFTHPAFRRLGIHRQSVCRSVTMAQQSGSRRHLSLVAKWNVPVLSTADKTGAGIVGSVGYWNLGFFRSYFARGAVRLDGGRVLLAPAGCSDSGAAVPRANTRRAVPR
jgi:hypothetical protein